MQSNETAREGQHASTPASAQHLIDGSGEHYASAGEVSTEGSGPRGSVRINSIRTKYSDAAYVCVYGYLGATSITQSYTPVQARALAGALLMAAGTAEEADRQIAARALAAAQEPQQ